MIETEYRWVPSPIDYEMPSSRNLNEKAKEGWRVVPGIVLKGCVLMERTTEGRK